MEKEAACFSEVVSLVWWLVGAVLVLFLWHEVEECRVLLPWLHRNREHLPAPMKNLSLQPAAFTLIALEELTLLSVISLFLPLVWFTAATIAYGFHLTVHCVQMLVTYQRGCFLPLWSAPIQLPIVALLAWGMYHHHRSGLLTASLMMIGVMVLNLVLMHALTARLQQQ